MKKVLLSLAMCAAFGVMQAQVLNVESISKIDIPNVGGDAKVTAISPQGDYVLVTAGNNQGLVKYQLATGATQELSTAPSSGYDVKVSADGQNIVYREAQFTSKHLKQTQVMQANLATGERKQLVKPTRQLNGVAVNGNTAITVNKGKLKAKALGKEKAQAGNVLWVTQDYKLMLNERELSPLGADKRYLWPQLSPDGTKALFFVGADAAYVFNLDGTGIQKLGVLRAAKWVDNNTVVGMNDTDDGYFTTSSQIVAVNLQGARQVLTGSDVIAMYPQVAPGKIAFSTPAGEAYIINLK